MPNTPYMAIQVGGHHVDSQRYAALVDVADAEKIGAHPWSMNGTGYAIRQARVDGKRRGVLMHRQILGLMHGDGIEVDHINGDVLDNRRANLRVCTRAQNSQNRHEHHRGVTWNARLKCWIAQVGLDCKRHHLGCFATQEEAAAVAAAFRRANMPYSSDARKAT